MQLTKVLINNQLADKARARLPTFSHNLHLTARYIFLDLNNIHKITTCRLFDSIQFCVASFLVTHRFFFVGPTAIPDNRCLKMHVVSEMFSSETEYDVALSLCFPEGLTKSFWSEIHKLASEKATNPKYEGDVINKWDFGENNLNLIVYQCEDSSNVGCDVTFKPKCDTVLVRNYKG